MIRKSIPNAILIPQTERLTMRMIREAQAYYHVSTNELNDLMYAPKSQMLHRILRDPQKHFEKRFVLQRFKNALKKLEERRGRVFEIFYEDGIYQLPHTIRITKPLVKCKGHQEVCTWVSERGYCDRTKECQDLANKKK